MKINKHVNVKLTLTHVGILIKLESHYVLLLAMHSKDPEQSIWS